MRSHAGRRVLVAGGTSGVGLATAKEFAALGAEVTVVSRSKERVDAAVAEVGGRCRGEVLDLRDADAVAEFCATAEFDHAVSSTAGAARGRADDLPLAAARAAMDSKFWSAYHLARSVRLRPGGSLTLVTGHLSVRPGPASALQSAVNGALEALVRALALELAPIRVNAVSPGVLRTPLWDSLPEEERTRMFTSAAQRLPAGRAGEASDVADAIAFLTGNGYTTGATVVVDGGGVIAC
ncbi:SDR family oxidoreductase [Actinacidiphila sp. bgisy144]|uniref:SDR family oxidoreductase n=1 Tax=Actinacidiphila sp. bgisy144 TaxID=3413791 RepID=UPI003EBD6246